MRARVDYPKYVGKKINFLTANEIKIISGEIYFDCTCDCGNRKLILAYNVVTSASKSCGCLKRRTNVGVSPKSKLDTRDAIVNALFNRYVQSSRKREIEFSLNKDDIANLISLPCVYCGDVNSCRTIIRRNCNDPVEYFHNSIDRVDNSLGYTIKNCVPCCKTCNVAKSNMSRDDFLSLISEIYKHTQEGL